MDRRSWITVVLCVISLFAWNFYYTSKYGGRPTQPSQGEIAPGGDLRPTEDGAPGIEPAPAAAAPGEEPGLEVVDGAPLVPVLPPAPSEPIVPGPGGAALVSNTLPGEETPVIDTPLARYTFTTYGGGIKDARLHQHKVAGGSEIVMNEFGKVPVGGITVQPKPANLRAYTVVETTPTKVVMETQWSSDLTLRKTYEVQPEEGKEPTDIGYLLRMRVDWINTGTGAITTEPYFVQLGEEESIYESDGGIYTTLQWQSNKGQAQRNVDWFKPTKLLWAIQTSGEKESFSETFKEVSWAGVANQFYATIISPEETRGTQVYASRSPESRPSQSGKIIYAIHGALGMPANTIQPGETLSQSYRIYTGPKEYSRLKEFPDNEQGILNFGFFSPISVFLLSVMNFFNKYLHSYALAIIGITIMLKILLWPLQTASMRSMKRMSDNMKVLQPKMEALKVKYKDNPTRLNEETMKLYKEHQINPMGGCLPSLAQFPIFLGFFYMLRTAVELRNSEFLWVEDLSRPDTVLTLLGMPINPLPLIMTASMVLYMKLQPSTGNDMQKKMMMFMPVMFLAFCYNFASALALYWTMQNILSIVQFYLTKDIREGKPGSPNPAPATAGATVGGKPAFVEPPARADNKGKGKFQPPAKKAKKKP